jgi:predicted transcriptional regulator of viral defense system
MKLSEYIENLVAKGKCTFTIDEAQKELGKSRAAITSSIEHLRKQKKVASPARGFYTIVMPEYRIYECLPAEYFIPYLMEYWQIQYYACLVTAASYHGASHQQPQIFQVMVEQYRKPIVCGKVKVEFIANKYLGLHPTQKFTTQRSELIISTPETTVMDIVNYYKQCGGLNRIATLLDELRENTRSKELLDLLNATPHLYWKQRLGYILDKLGAEELAQAILQYLQKIKRVNYISLDPFHKIQANNIHPRNEKWKIIENSNFESDL